MQKLIPQIDLVEAVKMSLFDAILTGKLLPGDKLSQDVLAEKMGVSRQPVIQALRILSENGILCPLGKKSLTVSAINKERLLSLLQVRSELDTLAARLAANRAQTKNFDDHDHAQIKKIQNLIETSLGLLTGDNHAILVRNDIEFHKALRSLSGNEFIQSVLEPYLLHHNRLAYIMGADRHATIWRQHQAILQAILDGNAVIAEALTRSHIVEAEIAIGWHRDPIG